jgi:TetR/AcrR family transcriptional regulator, cholesterol catabolism regulator
MEIKERILEGAYELFLSRGIKNVTMDEVSKHLHVSKKTIYKYFKDKDQVVKAFTEHTLMQNHADLDNIAQISKDPVEEILLIMKHLSGMFAKINPMVIYDLQKHYPGIWKLFKDFKENYMMGMVERNLKKGIKEGLYREKIDVKVIARLRLTQVEMAMNPAVFPPEKFNIGAVQLAMLDHFLHGITTLKGHKLINKYNSVVEEE